MSIKYALKGESTKKGIKMQNLFSIGEVAKLKDITIKALRYYHKTGILEPHFIDEQTGYRYYSIDQLIYIDVIKGCRALETSIAELQEIFKDCNTDKLLDFLQLKRQEAEATIVKMNEIIGHIDALNETVNYSRGLLQQDGICIQEITPRYVVVASCKEVGSLKELLYYSELEKVIQELQIEVAMERGILYEINAQGEAVPKYVFNDLKNQDHTEVTEKIKCIPGGKYLTLTYSKENEVEQTKKLFDYVIKNDIQVKDLLEIELFSDFFNAEAYNCQLQMLIE